MSGHLVRVEVCALRAVRFQDEKAKVPMPYEGPVLDLVGRTHAVRTEKKGTAAFSAVTYNPGASRGKRGVASVTAVVLDYDHLSSAAVEELHKKLVERGWAWLGYSSFSHLAKGEDDHCFRLLVLVSRSMTVQEHDSVWYVTDVALGGTADRHARDASRLWYLASCPPERAELSWVRWGDGRLLDVDLALAAYTQRRGRANVAVESGDAIPQGSRNAALTSLAGSARRRGAECDAILSLLRVTNASRCRPPLPDSELCAIADSVSRYQPESMLLLANHTDLGNAERFEAFAGPRLRYVAIWGSWLCYDGTRWQRDLDGEAVRTARDMLRTLAAAAENVQDEGERDELVRHALESESSGKITALLSLGQALLPVAPEALDADPDLLNIRNGTLDLRTGELRPHDRRDHLTRMAPVAYDPNAACPQWEAFLARILQGNERLIGFLRRAVGYSLTGHTSEQVLLLMYGVGANGKSTFLETVRALLGDYATQADFTTFLKRDSEGARNDLARLAGTRLVSAVEAEAGKPLAEALVKQLTGGDTITARFLFKEFFDYKPQFKIWLATNHKPTVTGSDHGIWRRLRLVPFTVTIPEAERDQRLGAKLLEELPGILAWAVRGCLEWRAEGLGLPDEVKEATESYREEMDVLGPFLEEVCLVHAEARTTAKELYAAYVAWAEANGEKVRSQKAVAMMLRERGFENVKGSKGVRGWRGLRVRGPVETGGRWQVEGASSRSPSSGPASSGERPQDPRTEEKAPSSATRHPSEEEGEL
jgi:putative DNA primase/helicase